MGKDPLPPEWEDDGDRSWIRKEEPGKGNGIGPVCKHCHRLVDWHPVDHALDCARNGDSSGLDQ